MKFGVISDLHFHNWSAFAQTDSTGLNTRLAILLREVERAAEIVRSQGGNTLIISGDVFHVRGSVAPSVLNPVRDLLDSITNDFGMIVWILAGNHDIEGKHSTRLGSAVTALQMGGDAGRVYTVSENPTPITIGKTPVWLVPWVDNIETLKSTLSTLESNPILIMHAPLNGVIKGLPENGIDPAWIDDLNKYDLVLSGHYHNHKCHKGKNTLVYSVGAIAHHQWNDVGSKAGFVIVDTDKCTVDFHASHAPSFVDIDSDMSVIDMQLAADGNYVRARVASSDLKELNEVREALHSAGALGVTVIPEVTGKTVSRASTSIKGGMTLAASVEAFIEAGDFDDKLALKSLSEEILNKAGSL